MSWEHFELGLRALQYDEQRTFLTIARAARMARVDKNDFETGTNEVETLAGLR